MLNIWKHKRIKFLHILIPILLVIIFVISSFYLINFTESVELSNGPIVVSQVAAPDLNERYNEILADINKISNINRSLGEYYIGHNERFNLTSDGLEGEIYYVSNQVWQNYFYQYHKPVFVSDSINLTNNLPDHVFFQRENRTINISSIQIINQVPLNSNIRVNTAIIYPLSHLPKINLNSGNWIGLFSVFLAEKYQELSINEKETKISSIQNSLEEILLKYGTVSETYSPYLEDQYRIFNYTLEAIIGLLNPIMLLLLFIEIVIASIFSYSILELKKDYDLLYHRGMSHSKIRNSFIYWNMFWILLSSVSGIFVIKYLIFDYVFNIFIVYLLGYAVFKSSLTLFLIFRNFRKISSFVIYHETDAKSILDYSSSSYLVSFLLLVELCLLVLEFENIDYILSLDFVTLVDRVGNIEYIILVGFLLGFALMFNQILDQKFNFNKYITSIQNKILSSQLDILYLPVLILGYLNTIAIFLQVRGFAEDNTNGPIPDLLSLNSYYLPIIITSILIVLFVILILTTYSSYNVSLDIANFRYNQLITIKSISNLSLKICLLISFGFISGFVSGMVRAFGLWDYSISSFFSSPYFIEYLLLSSLTIFSSYMVAFGLLYLLHRKYLTSLP